MHPWICTGSALGIILKTKVGNFTVTGSCPPLAEVEAINKIYPPTEVHTK